MVSRPGLSGEKKCWPDFRAIFAWLPVAGWLATMPITANAYLIDDISIRPCAVAAYGTGANATPPCAWSFETIAGESTTETDLTVGKTHHAAFLPKAAFAASNLTIEQTVAALSQREVTLLSWDRQVGIARELALDMAFGVEAGSLGSPHFLLMPAAFNEAFLADFIDFAACQTGHTFIFAGALDGRSDAPYVTKRWSAMKVPICLEIEGADCSDRQSRLEPSRMYFRIDYPCHYSPRRD